MKPEILNYSHEQIYNTYKELKRVLPTGLFKMKVLEKQRYPINKDTIINEIEKTYSKKIISSFQNINIFYNNEEDQKSRTRKTLSLPKIRIQDVGTTGMGSSSSRKTNNFSINNSSRNSNNSEIITYINFREKNMKMIGINCDLKLKRNRGLYNSFSVNDIDMKKNIYLPRMIDRMKYRIPRNLRNNKGFILLGSSENKLLNKYKELNFIKNKNNMPTDMFFYKGNTSRNEKKFSREKKKFVKNIKVIPGENKKILQKVNETNENENVDKDILSDNNEIIIEDKKVE